MRAQQGLKLAVMCVSGAAVLWLWISWSRSPDDPTSLTLKSQPCGNNTSGLSRIESVASLLPKRSPKFKNQKCAVPSSVRKLSKKEKHLKGRCIENFKRDHARGAGEFWKGETQYIRHKHHRYLTSKSLVIDIGGNKGEDADAMIQAYHPGIYVILEPINSLFTLLVEKFKSNENVILYNFGLAARDSKFYVNVLGHGGDATSVFQGNKGGKCELNVFNTTDFMYRLGVPCLDIDLITINCEGCEFEILETLISSGLISKFRHVQFATHPLLSQLEKPVERYCEIQERLARTHVIDYQFKFCWETWKRKDIS